LLPDQGKICETVTPPWQSAGPEHQIFCHIPLEQLRQFEPVVHQPALKEAPHAG
jgi:hypothetical protein